MRHASQEQQPATQQPAAERAARPSGGRLAAQLARSPRLAAQRRQLTDIGAGTIQRADGFEDEDEASQLRAEPAQRQENRTGMPDGLKAGIESMSGMDMSDVRVHRNSSQPAQLNALAYAQGNDIHLGPGQEQHLPHEAWHVVQQRQGRVQATTQLAGVGVNDDGELEQEADVMGGRALQLRVGADLAGISQRHVIQCRDTFTGVKMDVARRIYKNHIKGDPPFKPQYGTFGKVSWFAGTGNAYVGGQAKQYDVDVEVTMPEPTRLPNKFFAQVLGTWDPSHTKRKDKDQHADFWRTLGDSLVGCGLAEVHVPQGPLSRQGQGTFVTADVSARRLVALKNPENLAVAIGDAKDDLDKKVAADNADQGQRTKSAQFSFTVNKVDAKSDVAAQDELMTVARLLLTRPAAFTVSATPQATHEWTKMRGLTTYSISVTLTYGTYLAARKNAKSLASNASAFRHFGTFSIQKGANWSDTAVRAYTANY